MTKTNTIRHDKAYKNKSGKTFIIQKVNPKEHNNTKKQACKVRFFTRKSAKLIISDVLE